MFQFPNQKENGSTKYRTRERDREIEELDYENHERIKRTCQKHPIKISNLSTTRLLQIAQTDKAVSFSPIAQALLFCE